MGRVSLYGSRMGVRSVRLADVHVERCLAVGGGDLSLGCRRLIDSAPVDFDVEANCVQAAGRRRRAVDEVAGRLMGACGEWDTLPFWVEVCGRLWGTRLWGRLLETVEYVEFCNGRQGRRLGLRVFRAREYVLARIQALTMAQKGAR